MGGCTEELADGLDAPSDQTSPELESVDAESRELWRVVSIDGSTRIFQTKPALEPGGRRSSVRRVAPCSLTGDAEVGPLGRGSSALPSLIADSGPMTSLQGDTDLSVELTSVTQAWPSLSPGIRGAVMALIRAASTGRPPRPAAAPRRE